MLELNPTIEVQWVFGANKSCLASTQLYVIVKDAFPY